MKKILCPIDFSECSLNAVEFATRIAEKHHSTLTLFHVFTESEFRQTSSFLNFQKSDYTSVRGYAEELLSNMVETIKKDSKSKGIGHCDYHFSDGPLYNQVTQFANKNQYSWIVMGTAGVHDIQEYYAGSNTVKVIEKSQTPVLCVPYNAAYEPIKKIVYATDFQDEDVDCLQKVIAFAYPFNAKINVLHINENDNMREEAVYKDFQRYVESYVNYSNLHFTRYTAKNTPYGIDEFMNKEGGNLLVLLTRHRNFFERLFTKSTTESLSFFATYPLLAFKS